MGRSCASSFSRAFVQSLKRSVDSKCATATPCNLEVASDTRNPEPWTLSLIPLNPTLTPVPSFQLSCTQRPPEAGTLIGFGVGFGGGAEFRGLEHKHNK